MVVSTHPVLRSDRVRSLGRDGPVGHQLGGPLQLLVNLPVGGLVVLLHYGLLWRLVARRAHLIYVMIVMMMVMVVVILYLLVRPPTSCAGLLELVAPDLPRLAGLVVSSSPSPLSLTTERSDLLLARPPCPRPPGDAASSVPGVVARLPG